MILLRAGRPGFYSRQEQEIFLHSAQIGSGAHLASCISVPGATSPRANLLGREADLSFSSSIKAKNDGAVPALLRTFHGVVLN